VYQILIDCAKTFLRFCWHKRTSGFSRELVRNSVNKTLKQ